MNKKFIFSILISWLFVTTSQSQFTLIGSKINGTGANEESGFSTRLSDDGKTVVIGSPLSTNGHVRVLEEIAGVWTLKGSQINGAASGDEFGYATAINGDGTIIAVGSLQPATGTGNVKVFSWDGTSWLQMGATITGVNSGEEFGCSVSLNNSGNILAIGARESNANGTNSGQTKVYEWDGVTWNLIGSPINGEASQDFSGYAVSLNNAGNILAIGAIDNDGGGSSAGHTRIYEWDGSAWTQKGSDIDGQNVNDLSGCSVSLSADGLVVAIGERANDATGSDAGRARVFAWSGTTWIQKGGNINGEAAGDFSGYSVDMDEAGEIIAIGASDNDAGGISRGHVRVYFFNGSSWFRAFSQDLDGAANNDFYGGSVSLNRSGERLSVGARRHDAGGINAGATYIYKRTNSISACATTSFTETLVSQTEVNNFQNLYPGCTEFLGNLRIIDNNDAFDNVIDLSPLLPLTHIHGDLIIQGNQNLEALLGLDDLIYIGDDLNIDNNDMIGDLDGLFGLDSIIGDLIVERNDGLTTMSLLNDLVNVGGSLIIRNNLSLIDLDGMNNLNYIGSNFTISGNDDTALSIDGFNGLEFVDGTLTINNNGVTSINGFQNLNKVIGSLRINDNPFLTSLDGFTSLDSVGGINLLISQNNALTIITGFDDLSKLTVNLDIDRNLGLTTITGFGNLDKSNGLRIFGNTALTNINGFAEYDSCFALLQIQNNALPNLNGLRNLKSVTGNININTNADLVNVDSLHRLTQIGGSIFINNNDALVNLNGFRSLTSFPSGGLNISGNELLSNVDSLYHITYIDQVLTITNNPNLLICCGVFNVIDNNGVNGGVNISNNGVGCNDITDIQNGGACPPPCEISLTSAIGTDNQTQNCLNNITTMQYTLSGVLDGIVTGLPNGISYSAGDGEIEITGYSTESGIFNYTVTPNSPCSGNTMTGTITVNGNAPVKINTTCYLTLEEALAEALTGDIIDVYDVISPTSLTILQNISVRLNTNAIWNNNATLTNNGTITLNGGNFTNSSDGIYKGVGTFIGNFLNQGSVRPGN